MKKIAVAAIAIILIATCAAFTACADPTIKYEDKNLGTADETYRVDGLSAYDVIIEAYENWCSSKGYRRDEEFAFSAKLPGGISAATRKTEMVRKVNGDAIYSQEIIFGTGQDKGTAATRYYFDGKDAWDINNTNKKTIKKEDGKLSCSDWGEFAPFSGDKAEQNRVMTRHLTTYDFSKREYLSDKHNDGVFLIEGIYYCTMTIDCSNEMLMTVQKAAFDEFIDLTGAKEEGFEMEDSSIDFALEKTDEGFRFLAWRRNEKYSGNHESFGFKVSCEQTCYSRYSYDEKDYEITSEDLLNLA